MLNETPSKIFYVLLGHQLCPSGGEVRADHHGEHHLHDGAGFSLPLSLRQPPHHSVYQTCGDLAPLQPGLPILGHHGQHHQTGQVTHFIVVIALTFPFPLAHHFEETKQSWLDER